MKRFRRLRTTAALLALMSIAAACGDDDEPSSSEPTSSTTPTTGGATTTSPSAPPAGDDFPDSITFGAVPSEESTALQESYAAMIEAIEQELGVEVEFQQAADYAGVIEGMIAGHIDLAQFGPFSYVLAELNGAALTPIGAQIDGPDEEPGYQSYGIARADDASTSGIADFAGKQVCFVDPNSTSGFLYPVAGLISEGIVASATESDLAATIDPVFAGGHDASVISVVNGDCEVGFAFDAMVEGGADGAVDPADLKIVWESEVIAGSPLAMSTDLPPGFQAALTELVQTKINLPGLVELGICASEDDCDLTDEDIWGYAAVDNAFYDGVREVCTVTKAPQCQAS